MKIHNKTKAVNALLQNGANIDNRLKNFAHGTIYEKIVSDEVVRRVGISD